MINKEGDLLNFNSNRQDFMNPSSIYENEGGFISISTISARRTLHYLFDYRGNVRSGWPVLLNEQIISFPPPSNIINDLDNDGNLEILTISRLSDNFNLNVFNEYGNLIFPETYPLIIEGYNLEFIINDLDNDGRYEIIVANTIGIIGSRETFLQIYNMEGEPKFEQPIKISNSLIKKIIAGDLDNDGYSEILIASNEIIGGELATYDWEGNKLWYYHIGNGFIDLALGDLNNDDYLETVVSGGDFRFFVLDRNGRYLIPPIDGGTFEYARKTNYVNIADIDGDGEKDIIGTIDYIPTIGEPVPEIDYSVVAYKSDGSLIEEWPITSAELDVYGGPPTITDIDSDSTVEIVLLSSLVDVHVDPNNPGISLGEFKGMRLDILSLNGEYHYSTMDWPMFRHDPQRTASYSEPIKPKNLFVRGDSNGDETIDITDAVFILNYLFRGGETPSCLDAADADDNDQVELTDAIRILNFLFRGGIPPAPPLKEE